MVVKKFGSQVVCLAAYAPANGYVIDLVFCECHKLSVRFVFTHRNLVPLFIYKEGSANCLGVIWSSLTGN